MQYISVLFSFFLVCSCSVLNDSSAKLEDDIYGDDFERFAQNVSIKEETPRFVTYEYKDVRIDEIASLAARYCEKQSGKTAFLRDNITYRNHLRRATFDCLNLQ